MDSARTRVLAVAQQAACGGSPGPFPEALAAHSCASGVADALVHLAQGGVRLLLLDERMPDADLRALASAAHRRGLMAALAVERRGEAELARALDVGCRAAVARGATAGQCDSLVSMAGDLHRQFLLEQQDLQGLESRYEALRQRSVEQAERFQEIQETFFLDLSRVMTIISSIMDGIVYADRDGNVALLNAAAEDLLGVEAFAAVGKPLRELHGRAELMGVIVRDQQRMEETRETRQTVEVHHSEQDLLYIKCTTSRVSDYRGQPAGSLTVLEDVTAEFKTDQLKNQYLSIVAHELRTPLTGIKTFSTMLAKGSLGSLTERQQRVAESIREQSGRLEHQIDKLINLGHLESDEYGQDRESFSVDELCAGMLAPFEQPARDRGIALTMTCEVGGGTMLHADRADLRRACQAILENAVKFTPDGGAVHVKVTPGENGAPRFSVRDTGIGIDPRYQRRIFEKFFQVEDPLTRHHGGAGLGLFVAKGIVEAHGSRIEVASKLGEGAEFSFALPVEVPVASTAETASQRSRD